MRPIVIFDSTNQDSEKVDHVINKILQDILLQISGQYEENAQMTDLAIFGATDQEKLNVKVQDIAN